MSGMNLPTVCSMRRNMGIPCPGCGLTRAFVTAIRGDFKASSDYHRMGPFIFFYIVAQGLCQLFWFAIPSKRETINRAAVVLNWLLLPIGAFMGIDWLRGFF